MDPLELPATSERLQALRDAGVLSTDAFERALALSHATLDAPAWREVASRGALVLGALLCLAGSIYFVAANWAGMDRWRRLGVVEVGVALCAALAWRARSRLARRMALTLAAALLGPLLAVFSQTYQTGADPWELFFAWALLATPFAVAARFAPLWLAIAGLLDVSLSLWSQQVQLFDSTGVGYTAMLVGAANAIAWLVLELVEGVHRPGEARYPRRALATVAVLAPLPVACGWVAEGSRTTSTQPWAVACFGLVVALGAAFLILDLRGVADRYRSTLLGLVGCSLFTSWLWSQPDARHREWPQALGILLAVTLAASWIRRSGRRQHREMVHAPR